MEFSFDEQISKINSYLNLNNIHIFYLTLSAEKARGVDELIPNFHIICSLEDDFWKEISNKNNHFLLKNELIVNSYELLKNIEVINFINNFNSNAYIQTFKINPRMEHLIEENSFKSLNNNSKISKYFESKFNLIEISKKCGFDIPRSQIVNSNELKSSSFPIVLQNNIGHTGDGTFIIENELELEKFIEKANNIELKQSEFIDGIPFNINAVVTKNKIMSFGLNIQQTNIDCLSLSKSVTVGNNYDYSDVLSAIDIEKTNLMMSNIGKEFQKRGYKGLFGVDLIKQKNTNKIYVIEINARQTANVTFYNQIQNQNKILNGLILHIISFFPELNLLDQFDDKLSKQPVSSFQLICRNYSKDFFKIPKKTIQSFHNPSIKVYFSDLSKQISIGSEVFRIQKMSTKLSENTEEFKESIKLIKEIKLDIDL